MPWIRKLNCTLAVCTYHSRFRNYDDAYHITKHAWVTNYRAFKEETKAISRDSVYNCCIIALLYLILL